MPAEADRIAQLKATVERNRTRQPELFRIYSLRPDGERFVFELEDELLGEYTCQIEERIRSRLRRKDGVRVRFVNPHYRRDARDPEVLYCHV